eukprot:234829_1
MSVSDSTTRSKRRRKKNKKAYAYSKKKKLECKEEEEFEAPKNINEFTRNSAGVTNQIVSHLMKTSTTGYRGIPFLILASRDKICDAETYYLHFEGFRFQDITPKRVLFMIKDTVEFYEKLKWEGGDWKILLKRRKYNYLKDKFYAETNCINKDVSDGTVCEYVTLWDISKATIRMHVTSPQSRAKMHIAKTDEPHHTTNSNSNKSKYKCGRTGKSARSKNQNEMDAKVAWLKKFKEYILEKNGPWVAAYLKDERVHGWLWIMAQNATHDPSFQYKDAANELESKIAELCEETVPPNTNTSTHTKHSHKIMKGISKATDRSKLGFRQSQLSVLSLGDDLGPRTLIKDDESYVSEEDEDPNRIISDLQTTSSLNTECLTELQSNIADMIVALNLFFVMIVSLLKKGGHFYAESTLKQMFPQSVYNRSILTEIRTLNHQGQCAPHSQPMVQDQEEAKEQANEHTNPYRIEIWDVDTNKVTGWYCKQCQAKYRNEIITCVRCHDHPSVIKQEEPQTEMPSLSPEDPMRDIPSAGILMYQTVVITEYQAANVAAHFMDNRNAAPMILFSDNNLDKERDWNTKRLSFSGQSAVLGVYDRWFSFGITTEWKSVQSLNQSNEPSQRLQDAHPPSFEAFRTIMDHEFQLVQAHLESGRDVLVPQPSKVELLINGEKYCDQKGKQVIFHSLMSEMLDLRYLRYIQSKLTELESKASETKQFDEPFLFQKKEPLSLKV